MLIRCYLDVNSGFCLGVIRCFRFVVVCCCFIVGFLGWVWVSWVGCGFPGLFVCFLRLFVYCLELVVISTLN